MLGGTDAQPFLEGRVEVPDGDRGWGRVSTGVHTPSVINDCSDVKLGVMLFQTDVSQIETLLLKQYHHERRQPGDKIARPDTELVDKT